MPENYECHHCEKTFINRRHYELHVNGHLRNSCRVCGLPCNSRKTLAVHMSAAHGSKLEPVVLECKYCTKTFVQKRSLHSHYKTVHKDTGTICLDCGQLFDTGQELLNHAKTVKHGDGFVCHRCGEVFTRSQQYKLHLQRHDAYCCYNCKAQFANSKKLNKHLKQCISMQSTNDYSKNKQGAGVVYECIECNKTFEKKKNYKRHLKTTVHSINKVDNPFYCAHCPKIFYYKFKLSSHMKQVHFKQHNNYICNLCGQSFLYRNNYKRHKESHVQVRNYVCEHCGACFYRKHALHDHQIAVHNNEKNFICDECGECFKLKSILTRHMRNHLAIKKYPCYCNRVFKFASNLRRHQVNVHNQVFSESIRVKRFVEDNSRLSPWAVMNEEKKIQKLKQKNASQLILDDAATIYSMMAYSDNWDLSSVDIAESVLQVASASNYKIECEENSCFPGIHPPIETSLVCSLNDDVDLSPNSSQNYLSDYVVPHQFPFLNI